MPSPYCCQWLRRNELNIYSILDLQNDDKEGHHLEHLEEVGENSLVIVIKYLEHVVGNKIYYMSKYSHFHQVKFTSVDEPHSFWLRFSCTCRGSINQFQRTHRNEKRAPSNTRPMMRPETSIDQCVKGCIDIMIYGMRESIVLIWFI